MNEHTTNRRSAAKLAGWSLILMAIVAGIGFGYAFGAVYVKGDGVATLNNILHQTTMLPMVMITFSIILLLDVVVAWALYKFFKQASFKLSLLSAWLRMVYCIWLAIAILQLQYTMGYADVEDAAGVLSSLDNFLDIWSQGLIVFGVHLLLIGVLAYRSRAVPRLIGGLAMFAGVAYIGTNILQQLWGGYVQYKAIAEAILSLPMALGELLLAVWLIWKGGK